MKTHTKKNYRFNDDYYFEIFFNVHGKNKHIEKFKMKSSDVPKAIRMGYLNGFYLDWKPMQATKMKGYIKGGLYEVDRYSYDDKYIYAHTKEVVFSLPKYLEKDIKGDKKYILFGQRIMKGDIKE